MLIHGKVTNVQVDSTDNPLSKEIKIDFKDNSTHSYLYKEEKIYFIVEEYINGKKEEIKYITLCESIKGCNFSYQSNTNLLTTSFTINDLTYNNNFKINI